MSELLPQSWSLSTIGESCEILDKMRIPLNKEERSRRQGIYPYYGANGIQDFIDGYIYEGEAVLLAEDGGYFNEWDSRPIAYLVQGKYWVNNHAHILKGKNDASTKWVFYSLVHKNILRYINGGTRAKLNQSDMRDIEILLATEPEQHKIGAILTSVDEVIEKTQSQINKLQDLKKGMMQDLLTKGIGHTEFKDSPVGRIPEVWNVVRFKNYIQSVYSGWSPVCDSVARSGSEWAILKTTAVVWDGYNPNENKRLPAGCKSIENATVKKNDILVTRKGPRDRVGVSAFVKKTPKNLMIPDTVFRVVLKNGQLLPAYAALAIGSDAIWQDWDRKKVGLAEAQVNINHQIINATLIGLPPVEEQESILGSIRSVDMKIKHITIRFKKLSHLKRALMEDLLTGKVRVNA